MQSLEDFFISVCEANRSVYYGDQFLLGQANKRTYRSSIGLSYLIRGRTDIGNPGGNHQWVDNIASADSKFE